MVEVPFDLVPSGGLPVRAAVVVGLAADVGDVAHEEHAENIGPVKLAGNLGLDVDAEGVEADASGPLDLLLHETVAREGVEAVRMVGLVEGHLEVDRLPVQGHIPVVRAGEERGPDAPHAEIRPHPVPLHAVFREYRLSVVKVRVVEGPEPRRDDGYGDRNTVASGGDLYGDRLGPLSFGLSEIEPASGLSPAMEEPPGSSSENEAPLGTFPESRASTLTLPPRCRG